MPKRNITDRTLKGLKPPVDGRRYELMDTNVPGFGVRVSRKGKLTFILFTRYPSSKHPARRELGRYGTMSLEQARQKARDWTELISKGIDPKSQIEKSHNEDSVHPGATFARVVQDYLERAVEGPDKLNPIMRTASKVKRCLQVEFRDDKVLRDDTTRKGLGPKPIGDVLRQDIQRVIKDAVARGAPGGAHDYLAIVKSMFNWAVDQGEYGIETSPCDRMKPKRIIGVKPKRNRFHSDEEIKVIWKAAQQLGYPYGPLLLLLILLGRRKSEVAEARWCEFDFKNKFWKVPDARMKGQVADVVPLTETVIEILKSLPRYHGENAGDFVFSTTFGKKPVNGFSKIKERLDGLIMQLLAEVAEADRDPYGVREIDHYVIHDFRRTIRTNLPRLGVKGDIAELILAHKKPGIQAVYDLFEYLDEKRDALERWDSHLRGLGLSFQANVEWPYARKPRWLTEIRTEGG